MKFLRKRAWPAWNHWWLLLCLWLSSAIPELVLHIATARENAMFNSGMLLSILFAAVPAMIIFAVVSLIPKKGMNLGICIGYSVLYALLAGSQLVYYKIFGVFYTTYSMLNGGQALMDFWKVALNTLLDNFAWVLVLLIPVLFFSIFSWRLFKMKGLKSWKLSVAALAGAVAIQMLLIAALPLFGGKNELSAYDLYHNTADTYYGINKLGLLTGFRLDMARHFSSDEPEGSLNLDLTTPSFVWPTTSSAGATESTGNRETQGTDPSASTVPEVTEPTQPPIDTSPNILDIDFDTLIDSAATSQIKQMHQYFQSQTASAKNEYTGIFAGCNLILITAEGFSSAIIDEERTPTLYKMMTEGIYLDNYYVPNWGVSTTDGEYAFLTGTIPKSGVWSFYKSASNSMPLTMSKQLIAQGYNAYAYHGHTYNYYHRDEYLENLGYRYKGYGNGLNVKYTWPESDVEVVDLSTADFVNSEPFVTYYMSISGHLGYTFMGNYIAWKNRALVADEPYSDNVRAYLSCQIEFDRSLELLLQRLEEAGVLENTVIVITADHYPYGLTNEEYSELQGHTLETNFEIYKNGCIIYKPGMEGQVVSELSCHLDLLPTLSNMFGLEFDSRLYMGRDIFSDAEPLVVFANRSWMTDYVSYNSATGKYEYFTDAEIPEGYTTYIKNKVSNMFTISQWILDYDYWKILFPDK